jgi:hypothetical protein
VRFGSIGMVSEKQDGQQPNLRELILVYRLLALSLFLPGDLWAIRVHSWPNSD